MSEKVYVYTCPTPEYEVVNVSPAPSPSPVVEVTEEMVEAARNAYREAWEDVRNTGHEAMRAALVAALRVR